MAGLAAVDELIGRLGIVEVLGRGIGPIKQRDRGLSGGQLLVGMASAQLVGQDCLDGMDRVRADGGSALLTPVAPSRTAARLAGRFGPAQLTGIETALSEVYTRWLRAVPAQVRAPLVLRDPTIDRDASDIEVYGQPVRQHLDLAQVPAAHALRGVLPGLVVPAPVLLLLRVDPISLQQVWFRPDQAGNSHGRQVPVAAVLAQHRAVVPERRQRVVQAGQPGLRGRHRPAREGQGPHAPARQLRGRRHGRQPVLAEQPTQRRRRPGYPCRLHLRRGSHRPHLRDGPADHGGGKAIEQRGDGPGAPNGAARPAK